MPVYAGLELNPCIPKAWNGFKVTRRFRGATYHIEVKNPSHVSKGVKSVLVDGQEIAGRVVPAFDDGGEHRVEVTMG